MEQPSNITFRELFKNETFAIHVCVEEKYTATIQIINTQTNDVLQILKLDPTDRTVLGAITRKTLAFFGSNAEDFLKTLSDVLLSQLGAKEFILIPPYAKLPQFALPKDSGFSRMRYAKSAQLKIATSQILQEEDYRDFSWELKKSYRIVELSYLFMKKGPMACYRNIDELLPKANFTPGKMEEYKKEKISRFENKYVNARFLVNAQNKIEGCFRAIGMDDDEHFLYVSDEIINPDILPWKNFTGNSEEEKKQHRYTLIFAYLMQGLAVKFPEKHFIIIAADGREALYEKMGWGSVPDKISDAFQLVMKLSPPGLTLKDLQKDLNELFEKANKAAPSQAPHSVAFKPSREMEPSTMEEPTQDAIKELKM